jgi:hypothetical protein
MCGRVIAAPGGTLMRNIAEMFVEGLALSAALLVLVIAFELFR